jgi:hypothetical protein
MLQVFGAFIELCGLATVAYGISETRRGFDPTRPSLLNRGLKLLRRIPIPFRKKPESKTVAVSSSVMAHMGANVRVKVGWGPWEEVPIEERIARLRVRAEEYQDRIIAIEERLDEEETARASGDNDQLTRLSQLETDLRNLVSKAAAGGLGLEAAGVLLFATGLVLQVLGSVIA